MTPTLTTADVQRLIGLLQEIEWSANHCTLEYECCPSCGVSQDTGVHATTCKLAYELAFLQSLLPTETYSRTT